MTVTNLLDLTKIKGELINFLRVNITDANSRGTARTQLLSGDDIETNFNISTTTAKSITTVEYPVGTALTFGTDYTYDTDYDNAGTKVLRITFVVAPATGVDNIEINYKDGASWIYPDYPQPQSLLSDFPRIAVDVIGGISRDQSLDGNHKNTMLTISITCYDKDSGRLENTIDEIREKLLDSQKSFYYTKYLSPSNISPIIYVEGTTNKILQRTIDFDSLWNIEVIS